MINAKISENFNKKINIIIDFLINNYGQEYSSLIKKNINEAYKDFTSTPIEDYNYATLHNLNKDSKIISRYNNFKSLNENLFERNLSLLANYIYANLLTKNSKKSNIKRNPFLFTSIDYGCALIDSFNSINTGLLNDENTPILIKEKILSARKQLIDSTQKLGIYFYELSPVHIDALIKYREKLKIEHQIALAAKSDYGKYFCKRLESKINVSIPLESIIESMFIRNPAVMKYSVEEENKDYIFNYLKFPLTLIVNMGAKALDVDIIHELIHIVESHPNNPYTIGIAYNDGKSHKNYYINEIRTQKIAIQITKLMHKNGIFIFDDPDNYIIEGESLYESLFPITYDFLDKYETFISNCAINNEYSELNKYFGKEWELFSKAIDEKYLTIANPTTNFGVIANASMNEEINPLLAGMARTYKEKTHD